MFWNWFGFGRKRRERFLFTYRDGAGTVRRADPVVIEEILTRALGPEWYRTQAELTKPFAPGLVGDALDVARAEREALRRKFLNALCTAFDVNEFRHGSDPAGLGAIELFALFDDYCRFAAYLLELARPFVNARPRESPPTATQPVPSGPECTLGGAESPAPAIAT